MRCSMIPCLKVFRIHVATVPPVVYSVYVSIGVNGFLYCVSLAINCWELFANPSVQYDQQLEGHEREVAITHGYRRLKFFLLQLIALIFVYTLGAYYYKSIVRNTPVDWLSIIRWLIEAFCDHLYCAILLISLWLIPTSITELDTQFAVHMDIILIIKMNQSVMMRYAEFHSHACLNTIHVVVFYHLFCPKHNGYSVESILAACLSPSKYLRDVHQ
jgi:hypothetical protein